MEPVHGVHSTAHPGGNKPRRASAPERSLPPVGPHGSIALLLAGRWRRVALNRLIGLPLPAVGSSEQKGLLLCNLLRVVQKVTNRRCTIDGVEEHVAQKIIDTCISCGACEAECPNSAISQGDSTYVVDPTKCDECAATGSPACVAVCPTESITKA